MARSKFSISQSILRTTETFTQNHPLCLICLSILTQSSVSGPSLHWDSLSHHSSIPTVSRREPYSGFTPVLTQDTRHPTRLPSPNRPRLREVRPHTTLPRGSSVRSHRSFSHPSPPVSPYLVLILSSGTALPRPDPPLRRHLLPS